MASVHKSTCQEMQGKQRGVIVCFGRFEMLDLHLLLTTFIFRKHHVSINLRNFERQYITTPSPWRKFS